MMIPDRDKVPRFAFFASGAAFSRAVFNCLTGRGRIPALVVLPEYPPTRVENNLLEVEPARAFLDLVNGIELAYAPRSEQESCARLLRKRDIDYLLVACWPYLIGQELIQVPHEAALNLHPSMLPEFRGPDPVAAQLEAANPIFGVTLHLLDDRFDHGAIVAQSRVTVNETDRDRSVIESKCAEAGVDMFIDAIGSGPAAWQCRFQQ